MKKLFGPTLYLLFLLEICFFTNGMMPNDFSFIILKGKVFAKIGNEIIFLININDFVPSDDNPEEDSLNVVNSNDSKNFEILMSSWLSSATNNRNGTLSKSKSCSDMFSVDKNLCDTESEDQINAFLRF